MREIKFRFYSEDMKQYYSVTDIDIKSNCFFIVTGIVGMKCVKIYGLEQLEQYTGLKDKNGKEIYEGDKVFYSCSVEEGTAEIKSHGNVNLYFDWIDSTAPPTISDIFGCAKELEIIGNIHD